MFGNVHSFVRNDSLHSLNFRKIAKLPTVVLTSSKTDSSFDRPYYHKHYLLYKSGLQTTYNPLFLIWKKKSICNFSYCLQFSRIKNPANVLK